jgi:hypothetical protein
MIIYPLTNNYCSTAVSPLREGNLPTVWEEVRGLQPLHSQNTRQEVCYRSDGKTVEQVFRWVTGVAYKGHGLNWLTCTETIRSTKPEDSEEQPKTTSFVHIADLSINARNIADTSNTGRLRWNIENEG